VIVVIVLLAVLRQTGCGCGPSLEHVGADFRPQRDGYSFQNAGDRTLSDDWDAWKFVFGDDPGSRKNYADQVQHVWDEDQNKNGGIFSGGVCFGLAGSALSIYDGWNKASDFDQAPVAGDTHAVRAPLSRVG
jgi:hypothetical protein